MSRFFIDATLELGVNLQLTDQVFHHWVKVLRAQLGAIATLFNGQGGEYQVTLIEINKKDAVVSVDQFNPDNRTPNAAVVIGQVMSKGDRMDFMVQKATELGVRKIQLLTSERCEMRLKYERDQKKINHWQAIAIAACEQCGMNIIPEILTPLSLEQWLATDLPTTKLVMAPDTEKTDVLADMSQDIALLIGPEGGLSHTEIDLAQFHGFKNWCIGDRVLRTETAPIVALSIIIYKLQNYI
ncbi:16S rRNA (uracil(1498)-N(3))-methyltransferase [Acinetobacter rudis]|uniref:Ribosomal RNA small subunit methyltransferase E n=1 Tax=Acinetobacter rudis TaxID=632955 RepID=A0AAW8J956_9GAMM|nr:16S rRNA (uracil(1498)-N(3))-methyltransferase [Acinetobacter rudis]MDQ8935699.1 16S rRNA (uracil(1498)-N(3))-methyltransferase [Acinetobacter rudis]MDQ9017962.1 16S rRNA (uracil(1498)-N(3))-methyltransferase [Acinetobacter rudis]